MGWMEKRKEAGDSSLIGILVEQAVDGASENSSCTLILLNVRSTVFCWWCCKHLTSMMLIDWKYEVFPQMKICINTGDLQDW